MSNVVLFPKHKKDTPAQTIEELYKMRDLVKYEHIDIIIHENIMPDIFDYCIGEGFDIGANDCLKSSALIVEAITACLYRASGFEHPLHKVADDIFVIAGSPTESIDDNPAQ